MNGAESLVATLAANGVELCFTNPGTSEMHFVAALDRIEGPRCVLGLFEGVVTGAADGYYRMAGKPAATLLHLGPGLGNGLANLHNAKKARSGIVNIVGDHARDHARFESPLKSDIEGIARPVSHWVKTSASARDVAGDGAQAIAATRDGAAGPHRHAGAAGRHRVGTRRRAGTGAGARAVARARCRRGARRRQGAEDARRTCGAAGGCSRRRRTRRGAGRRDRAQDRLPRDGRVLQPAHAGRPRPHAHRAAAVCGGRGGRQAQGRRVPGAGGRQRADLVLRLPRQADSAQATGLQCARAGRRARRRAGRAAGVVRRARRGTRRRRGQRRAGGDRRAARRRHARCRPDRPRLGLAAARADGGGRRGRDLGARVRQPLRRRGAARLAGGDGRRHRLRPARRAGRGDRRAGPPGARARRRRQRDVHRAGAVEHRARIAAGGGDRVRQPCLPHPAG